MQQRTHTLGKLWSMLSASSLSITPRSSGAGAYLARAHTHALSVPFSLPRSRSLALSLSLLLSLLRALSPSLCLSVSLFLCPHKRTHAFLLSCIPLCTHARTHARTHAHTHTHTRMHARAHTQCSGGACELVTSKSNLLVFQINRFLAALSGCALFVAGE